ncbi:MAG: hypothetical protein R3C68_14760 [Myxococcota bacterium]
MQSRGWPHGAHDDLIVLGDDLVAHQPSAVLVDVCATSFDVEQAHAQLRRGAQPVVTIAIAEALEPRWLYLAGGIALLICCSSPSIWNVLTVVRAAITGASCGARPVDPLALYCAARDPTQALAAISRSFDDRTTLAWA